MAHTAVDRNQEKYAPFKNEAGMRWRLLIQTPNIVRAVSRGGALDKDTTFQHFVQSIRRWLLPTFGEINYD